jgi:hypothetical protein
MKEYRKRYNQCNWQRPNALRLRFRSGLTGIHDFQLIFPSSEAWKALETDTTTETTTETEVLSRKFISVPLRLTVAIAAAGFKVFLISFSQ